MEWRGDIILICKPRKTPEVTQACSGTEVQGLLRLSSHGSGTLSRKETGPVFTSVLFCDIMAGSFEEESRRPSRSSRFPRYIERLKVIGDEDYPVLVRKAVSLLAGLGAMIPKQYVGGPSFYDITRELKGYKSISSHFCVFFDRGIILEGVSDQVLGASHGRVGMVNVDIEGYEREILTREPSPKEKDEE